MDFAQPLEKATLVRRYKRFLADVVMDVDTMGGKAERSRHGVYASNMATQSISTLTPLRWGVPPTQVRVTRSFSK